MFSFSAPAPTPAPTNTDSVAVEAQSDDSTAYKDLNDEALKSLMRSFRLTDLQGLLIFAGKNKAGRKTELMVCTFNWLSNFLFNLPFYNLTRCLGIFKILLFSF